MYPVRVLSPADVMLTMWAVALPGRCARVGFLTTWPVEPGPGTKYATTAMRAARAASTPPAVVATLPKERPGGVLLEDRLRRRGGERRDILAERERTGV